MRLALNGGLFALVDDADFEMLTAFHWRVAHVRNSDLKYVVRHTRSKGARACILMHRVVMGCPTGLCVDHINRDGLDNRRDNLRVCTHAENMRNRKAGRLSVSGIKGVSFDPRRSASNPFRACIEHDGRRYSLGVFPTASAAHAAYVAAANKLHGEFARAA